MQKSFAFLIFLMIFFSVNAQNMASGYKNYSTFTTLQQKRNITPELIANTPETLRLHPEYGVLPYGIPKKNCFEILAKRTLDSRYFQDLANPQKFYIEKANGAIHYLNAQNQLISIDSRLRPTSTGIYEAPFQPEPKTLNVIDRYSSITVKGIEMKFNRNLHLWHEALDGTRTDLGLANWDSRIIGDEGMQIINVWEGVTMHVNYKKEYIKTDFLLHKAPAQKEGFLVITDDVDIPTGYYFAPDPKNNFATNKEEITGNLLIMNEKNQNVFSMGAIYVYDAKIEKKRQRIFPYKIHNETQQYEIRIPLTYLQDPDRKYPVTIDPTVTGPIATYGSGNIPFINNSTSYCVFNTSNYCSTNLPVTVPSGANVTAAYYATRYTALDFFSNGCISSTMSDCFLNEGSFQIYNSNCSYSSGILSCSSSYSVGDCYTLDSAGVGSPTSPGYIRDINIVDSANGCVIAQCSPYDLVFQMRTYACFSCNGGCQTDCHYMPSGIWKIFIEGDVPLNTLTCSATSNSPICENQDITLFGVSSGGQGSYIYSWQGPNGFVSNQQNPIINSATILDTGVYSLTVYDASNCEAQSTTNIVINQVGTATISSQSNICSGTNTNVIFTGTPSSTVYYNINGGITQSIFISNGSDSINTGNITTNTTYNLISISNGLCSQNITGSTTVNVLSLPTASITGTTSICAGNNANITFSGTPNALVTYNINNGSNQSTTLTNGTSVVNTGAISSNTVYHLVSVTDNICAQNIVGDATVTVNPNPIPNANGTFNILWGGSAQLNSTGGGTYSWQPSTGLNSVNIANPIASPTGTITYYVTVTNVAGCKDVDTVIVNVGAQSIDNAAWSQLIKVYPNPTDGNLWVGATSLPKDNYSISLYAINGQLLKKEEVSVIDGRLQLSFQLENMSLGVYMLRVVSKNGKGEFSVKVQKK